MKLFCLPYAGGSATVFSKWNSLIADKSIEVVPVEMPGRGIRFSEDLCSDMKVLVNSLYEDLKKDFIKEDYMIFGHSMGALISFYLSDKIRSEGIRQPSRLFVSGKEAPHIYKEDDIKHTLPDDVFMKKIYDLGGTPKELLENEDFLEIYIPILKNDYKLVADSKYDNDVQSFDYDITVFNGVQDVLTDEEIKAWSKFTNKKFKAYNFEGDHFFIHDHAKEMLNIILDQIKKDNILL